MPRDIHVDERIEEVCRFYACTKLTCAAYLAAFRARFQLMLQYRAAALAGFARSAGGAASRSWCSPRSMARRIRRERADDALAGRSPIPGSARPCWRCCPGSAIRSAPGRAHRRRRLRPAAAARRLRLLVRARRGLDAARALPRAVLMLRRSRHRAAAGRPGRLGMAAAGQRRRRRRLFAVSLAAGAAAVAVDRDADEHRRRREPQRARGECPAGADGDRVLGQPAAARSLSRLRRRRLLLAAVRRRWSTSRCASTSAI